MIDKKLIQMVDKANKDKRYQDVIEAVASKQNIHQMDPEHPAKKYKKVWKQLSVINLPNGRLVLYNKSRVVPPESAVQQLLQRLQPRRIS